MNSTLKEYQPGKELVNRRIALIGHVDVGKTTLIRKLGIKPLEEKLGITQKLHFYRYCENSVIIDLPGHQSFALDWKVGFKIANLILLVISASNIDQFIDIHQLGVINNKVLFVCLTKCDLDLDWKERISTLRKNLSYLVKQVLAIEWFVLPQDLEYLQDSLRTYHVSEDNMSGLVTSRIIHRGFGYGYEYINFRNNLEVYFGKDKLKILKEGALTSRNISKGYLNSNFSTFIKIGDAISIPPFSILSNFPKLEESEVVRIEDNPGEVLFSIRATNWIQVETVKGLIMETLISTNLTLGFINLGIGDWSTVELKDLKHLKVIKVSYAFFEADFQSLYEIEKFLKVWLN